MTVHLRRECRLWLCIAAVISLFGVIYHYCAPCGWRSPNRLPAHCLSER
jgi:hypothetical protein